MTESVYENLALKLDALPNGFPPTEDRADIRLLEYLFEQDEAELGSHLTEVLESAAVIAERVGRDKQDVRDILKGMAKKGLIKANRIEGGFGFGLLPFVVGIYEYQAPRFDKKMAELFEDYYQKGFGRSLEIHPQVHRVIPVNQTVKNDMEVRPYESALEIIDSNNSWAVFDCICRKQKAFIGDPCDHPIESCMTFSKREKAYDGSDFFRALTKEEAVETLMGAAEAGLVHSVSNSMDGTSYICNCCTCSCGILRGMSELGIANTVARSAFVNTVDPEECISCGDCMFHCQFDALELGEIMVVDSIKCLGCGVCVPFCEQDAMALVRRPESEILNIPVTEEEWGKLRMGAR